GSRYVATGPPSLCCPVLPHGGRLGTPRFFILLFSVEKIAARHGPEERTMTDPARRDAPTARPIGLRALQGALGGFVAVVVAVTASGIALGYDVAATIGLAAFSGVWAGVGFGFMMGGSLTFARQFDEEHAAATAWAPPGD